MAMQLEPLYAMTADRGLSGDANQDPRLAPMPRPLRRARPERTERRAGDRRRGDRRAAGGRRDGDRRAPVVAGVRAQRRRSLIDEYA